MRTLALVIGLCLATTAHAETRGVEGIWRGVLGEAPKGLRLVLSVSRSPDGSQRAVLDSIDQHAKIPVDSISTSNDKLKLEINVIGGVYEGTLEPGGNRIKGTWVQRGVPTQPLVFDRDLNAGAGAVTAAQADAPKGKAGPFGPPVEVTVPRAPVIATAHGKKVLVYELHVTPFTGLPLDLVAVEAQDDAGRKVWRSEGLDLAQRVQRVGHLDEIGDAQLKLIPGGRSVVYVWISLDGAVPKRLRHRLEIREADGVVRSTILATVDVTDGKLRIAAPLKGTSWMAANGPGDMSGHRRALIAIDGRASISQRFAIDWVKVGADGKTYRGDEKKNESYLAFGADALAVGAGTVVEIKDGIPENVPGDRAVTIDRETIAGNHVLLDLGGGRRALYAHLQPGSLKVKLGDKVKRGQVLGLVGNTGNSTEPHLHFHVAEGPSPLGAEGVPYTLEAFSSKKDAKQATAEHRKNEIPLENEIVDFAP